MARVHLFNTAATHALNNDKRRRSSVIRDIEMDEPSVPSLLNDNLNFTTVENATNIIPVTTEPATTTITSPPAQQPQTNSVSAGAVDTIKSKATTSPSVSHKGEASPTVQINSKESDAESAAAAAVAAATLTNQLTAALLQQGQHHDTSTEDSTNSEHKKAGAIDPVAVAATTLHMLGLSNGNDLESNVQNKHAAGENSGGPLIGGEQEDLPQREYKKGTWTKEEDDLLLAGIKKYGYGRWKEIATMIPGRKGKQLKQRWDNTLAAKYVDQEWLKNKIRDDQEQQRASTTQSSGHYLNDNRATKVADSTDWTNIVASKLNEKAKEGDHHAIETLLSQALLSTTAGQNPATDVVHSTPVTPTNNHSASSSPLQPNTAFVHSSAPTTPTAMETSGLAHDAELFGFTRSTSDVNTTPTLNYADAAALAIYAAQLSQHTAGQSSGSGELSNPYFLPSSNPFDHTSSASNSAVAAISAALSAMAQQQQHQSSQSDTQSQQLSNTQTNFIASTTTSTASATPSASSTSHLAALQPHPPTATISNTGLGSTTTPSSTAVSTTIGHKRRRSNPALADTQSAALSIYASSEPITTTVNNQTHTVYPCLFPNCGKTFARLYNLKSHSKTHTDDRPFVCSACSAAFSRNHDLKRHSKIHGGSKPYKCEGCQKSFSRLDALKRHKSNQRNKQTCNV